MKGRGEGKFPVAATYWFCPTDSRLLGCLPRKPNLSFCGLSRGSYMGALLLVPAFFLLIFLWSEQWYGLTNSVNDILYSISCATSCTPQAANKIKTISRMKNVYLHLLENRLLSIASIAIWNFSCVCYNYYIIILPKYMDSELKRYVWNKCLVFFSHFFVVVDIF